MSMKVTPDPYDTRSGTALCDRLRIILDNGTTFDLVEVVESASQVTLRITCTTSGMMVEPCMSNVIELHGTF